MAKTESFRGALERALIATCLTALAVSGVAAIADAAINVERSGSENPIIEVSRSITSGALAGTVVGCAVAFATSNNDNDGDIIRWGFVTGTLLGAVAGVYFVTHRPQPQAMLEFEHGMLALHPPVPVPAMAGGSQVRLVAFRF